MDDVFDTTMSIIDIKQGTLDLEQIPHIHLTVLTLATHLLWKAREDLLDL